MWQPLQMWIDSKAVSKQSEIALNYELYFKLVCIFVCRSLMLDANGTTKIESFRPCFVYVQLLFSAYFTCTAVLLFIETFRSFAFVVFLDAYSVS